MRTFAIVPVKNEWELTRALLWQLDAEAMAGHIDDVLVLDNGSADYTSIGIRRMKGYAAKPESNDLAYPLRRLRPYLHQTHKPHLTIYEMWNHGFARAERIAKREPFNVLVLNNDISLLPGWAAALVAPLRSGNIWATYPDVNAAWGSTSAGSLTLTSGVFGDGGMFGPCFALAGEVLPWRPLITDLGYRWWYGDNHLAECIEQEGGKQARVDDLPIRHENEGTARHYDLDEQKWQDRNHWLNRSLRAPRAIDRR